LYLLIKGKFGQEAVEKRILWSQLDGVRVAGLDSRKIPGFGQNVRQLRVEVRVSRIIGNRMFQVGLSLGILLMALPK